MLPPGCALGRARLLLFLLAAARAFVTAARSHRGGADGVRLPATELIEGREAGEARRAAQVFLDAEQLVVLGDAVGARERAGLDLPDARGDGEVCDEGVFGLARTVRDDGGAPGAAGHLDAVER